MKQLNQKTPWVFRLGVALLCVMLMTTHFTGNLYARYSTTATGSDSARVAKFAGGTVTCDSSFDIDLSTVSGFENCFSDSSGSTKYFAVEVGFTVSFEEAEVARKYTLVLTIAPLATIEGGRTSFKCPADTTCKLTINGDSAVASSGASYTTVPGLYYTAPDGVDVAANDDGTELNIVGYVPVGTATHNFTVTYFVPIYYESVTGTGNNIDAENDIIAYTFDCEQVD